MKPREDTIRTGTLLLVLGVLVAVAIGLTLWRDACHPALSDRQVAAARRMASAFPVLVAELEARGVEVDSALDPNRTGLIGEEFTCLTTTVGVLSAKRTSTNPEFAALLVRWLHDLNLEPRARVLVTLSGSFPALGIAAIIACEELNLVPIVQSSIGASMYGANRPDFTWLDIESVLKRDGVIHHTSSLVTLGGEADLGMSYPDGGLETARTTIRQSGIPTLQAPDPEAQARDRLAFAEGIDAAALINIGGNQFSIGPDGCLLRPGVIAETGLSVERHGLIGWFSQRGLPIIHLLGIRGLALEYALPQDPIPLPRF